MPNVPTVPKDTPLGRPSKYLPEYCEKVIELGKKGDCVYSMAEYFDVSVRTLYLWGATHDDWFNAFLRARDYSKAWLVRKMIDSLDAHTFQARLAELLTKFIYNAVDGDLIKIPALKEANTPKEQGKVIIDAMAVGHITTSQADRAMKVVLQCATAVEKTEIRDRLELLEQRLDA